jgi:hypothetical protein
MSATVPAFGDPRLPERFWAKVDVDPTTECWAWTGHRIPTGYGRVWVAGRQQFTHRFAFASLVGGLPDWTSTGLELDHLCRNRGCCNPSHLELVSHRENVLRGESIVVDHSRRTFCPRGHELAGENLRPSQIKRGWRNCQTCHRDSSAATARATGEAAKALGITVREYFATFGRSRATAENIVNNLARGIEGP